jgi:hypothetical protein
MNKVSLRNIFKLFVFALFFFLGCGFQTSFWPNVITSIPSPQVWLIVILFIIIRWSSLNYIFYIYFLSYCLTLFSSYPLKMLWTTLFITYFIIINIKKRIHLTGVFSFILLAFVGSFIFEVSSYILSDLLEPVPTSVLFFDRVLQILVNFIFSYPLYFALESLDKSLQPQEDWKTSSHYTYQDPLP